MATRTGRRFTFTCRHCGAAVLTTAILDDEDLARLREHVRYAHPHEELGPDAGIAETLAHYRAAEAT
jgi:hypothetical protein